MSSTEDLITWLQQTWESQEAEADAILNPPPGHYDKGWQADMLRQYAMQTLADIESNRRILDLLARTLATASECFTVESCDEDAAILAETMVRLLAQPYAGQPGWQEEWAA